MQWYETQRGAERFNAELALMRDAFPSFSPRRLDDGDIAWFGSVGPSALLRARYSVALVCPPTYTSGRPPRVEVLDPELREGAPHRYVGGALCVEHGDFGANDPITDVVGWAVQWLVLYERWLETGETW